MEGAKEQTIASEGELQQALPQLGEATALGVDLETDSMYAYEGRLCFLQVSTPEGIYVLDTLAEGVEASMVEALLADEGKRKVFHDAQGDLRVLAKEGLRVGGLFDTQRAATLLELPRVGLGDLVEERFGVRLAKELQTANFGERPVPEELMAYVADDVRFLLPLAEQLEEEARAKDIWEELELEFARIATEALEEPEARPRPRIPGEARTPLGLAVAEAVDLLRHEEAKKRNQPVGRVLSNAAVGEIARRRPRNLRELARVPGVKGSFLRPRGQEVLGIVSRLERASEQGELPPLPRRERQAPEQRARGERLRSWRSEAAKRRGVSTAVVLPTPLMERLAKDPPGDREALAQVPWFGEKRVELYGEALLRLLRG